MLRRAIFGVATSLLVLLAKPCLTQARLTSPGCTNSGRRVAVVTLATQASYEATTYAVMINSMWAHRHGYDFYVEACVPNTKRTHTWHQDEQHRANWAKPQILLKHLATHHLVFYLDADAFITDQSFTIEEFVESNMPEGKLLLFPKNCAQGLCWDDIQGVMAINTGAIIARHAVDTFDLLQEWDAAWNGVCKDFSFSHPREQACISLLYQQQGKQDVIQVIEDTHTFADFDGQWISHALGMTADRGAMTKRMQDHLLGLISPASGQTIVNWTKFVDNPVLGQDYGTVFDMHVLRETNGTYQMWLSWRPKRSIALSSSVNGTVWSEPQVVLSSVQTWEDDINRPCVLRLHGKYHMWFTGQSGNAQSSIGYATSPDGVTWSRISTAVLVPVNTWEGPAVMNPEVLYDHSSGRYRMWYSAGENYEPIAVGFATSIDGISWERLPEPVFTADNNSDWDSARVSVGQVVYSDGWYIMFYLGYSDIDHSAIGIARSKDGLGEWHRLPRNPILKPTAGTWDQDATYKPSVVFDGREWKLWYNGRSGSFEQIGLASFPAHDLWQ